MLWTGSRDGGGLAELDGHYINLLDFSQSELMAPAPMVLIEVFGTRVASLAACDNLSRPSISAAVVLRSLLIQPNPTVQSLQVVATLRRAQ